MEGTAEEEEDLRTPLVAVDRHTAEEEGGHRTPDVEEEEDRHTPDSAGADHTVAVAGAGRTVSAAAAAAWRRRDPTVEA